MSKKAWAYVGSIILIGLLLSGLALLSPVPIASQSGVFAVLTFLATCAQLFKSTRPRGHQSYSMTMIFLLAGVLLLHPFLFVLLVVIPHLIEWIKERLVHSPSLRAWYLQPFNIATHIIAGTGARLAETSLYADISMFGSPSAVFTVVAIALTYALLNHVIVGMALVLARGVSIRESGILDLRNLLTDFIMLCLGYVVAVLWGLNPWLIAPALSPLVPMYQALRVPQLERDASTDSKTGLWNARHFNKLFTAEMERARRFGHSLSIIMADLDLLRNINNTYGHLAGDAVLQGVGQSIRTTVREYDIASRFGGEEFVIALPETNLAEARLIGERLRAAVEAASFPVSTKPMPLRATMSLGVACFPEDGTTPMDLIHQADVAVYQAKLQGRNRVVCAADIPRSIRLEQVTAEDRLGAVFDGSYVPRGSMEPSPADPSKESEEARGTVGTVSYPKLLLPLFLGIIIVDGVLATALGFVQGPQPDVLTLGLLAFLALITQLPVVENLYGDSSLSVSVAITFAAALLAGIPGVALVSVVISLVHLMQRHPRLYKTAFNWANHVLAGAAPALIVGLLPNSIQFPNLFPILGWSAVAAVSFYFIETGLLAAAIALSEEKDFLGTWQERYRWLATHYVVLCLLGLFLSMAFRALGLLGLVVFIVPVLMLHYAQRQYLERTTQGAQELKRMNAELALANRETVAASKTIRAFSDDLLQMLGKIVDARDPYVLGHSTQVANYAVAIAAAMGLARERIEVIRQAATLHDVGKIALSENILHKDDRLTPEEYLYVQRHAALGAQFLETCQGLKHLAPYIKYHHEWWDGNGYPEKRSGTDIPVEARIIAVADAVESMASDRPYQPGMRLDGIIAEIRRQAGTQFDPTVVQVCIRLLEEHGAGLVVNSARQVTQKQDENGSLARGPLPAPAEPALPPPA